MPRGTARLEGRGCRRGPRCCQGAPRLARQPVALTDSAPIQTLERRVVGVLPDVSGVDRVFSYEVPPELDERIVIGAIVRVPLASRRVRGWVVEEQRPSDEV